MSGRRARKVARAELRIRLLSAPKPKRDCAAEVEYWQSRYFAAMAGNVKLMDHVEALDRVLSQLTVE